MSAFVAKRMAEAPKGKGGLVHSCLTTVLGLSFQTHILISGVLRLALIGYGQLHDEHSELPYTDIDYKVVTDGARHILRGCSPYARHTYRYSPLLAYLQLPNVLLHPAAGKVIYSFFDVLVAMLIYALVHADLRSQCRKAVQSLLNKFGQTRSAQNCCNDTDARNRPELIARASACFWLYNPLTAVISTRGNGDSFASFFVILTAYLLARSEDTRAPVRRYWLVFAAGLAHGFAIHLRLYPLLFSLAYFLCLSDKLSRSVWDFLRQLLLPSLRQLALIAGTIIGLLAISSICYSLYGWTYVYETYLYHFLRKDVRHNFSLYFLLQYLSDEFDDPDSSAYLGLIARVLLATPQLFLVLYLSFSFGQFRQTLPFCMFTLAFVMVTFNTVVTSQYFVWYLSLLPLCLNNLQSLSFSRAISLFTLWLLGQALWLLPAYLLEFKTWNTFFWIGAQGGLFFLVNNFLLTCLIEHYGFVYFKVNFKKLF